MADTTRGKDPASMHSVFVHGKMGIVSRVHRRGQHEKHMAKIQKLARRRNRS
jgi:hypothetical protein